jgi:hypothetical protein
MNSIVKLSCLGLETHQSFLKTIVLSRTVNTGKWFKNPIGNTYFLSRADTFLNDSSATGDRNLHKSGLSVDYQIQGRSFPKCRR